MGYQVFRVLRLSAPNLNPIDVSHRARVCLGFKGWIKGKGFNGFRVKEAPG